MRNGLLITFAFLLQIVIGSFEFANAQNVGIGTNTPQAALDVTSTTNGFLPPRMTFAQRNDIPNPAQGLMIYCTDCGTYGEPQYFNGISWFNLNGSPAIVNLPSVRIGTQIWSSQNLSVATYRNGDPIPQVTDPTQWRNLTTGAWCWYDNDSTTYAATYGRLYNWYAVNDPRGLAPQGWHVPTDAEWNKLTKFIDPTADTTQCCSNVAGTAMKSTTGWNNSGNGTNTSGFSGVPGGNRNAFGPFLDVGFNGYWWSASAFGTSSARFRYLYYNSSLVGWYDNGKTFGFSVRVVRD